MNFNHDIGTIDTVLTIDTTIAPPLGGTTGVLNIVGTGGIQLPVGTSAQQPTASPGTVRYNSTSGVHEGYSGTLAAWVPLDKQGTVTSVTVTGSTGLTVTGSPVTTSGTVALSLGTELQGLAGLASTGIVVRTGAGAYSEVTVTGTSGNITVTNGSGVAGNPTINLATVGTPVTGAFVDITTDAFGRVTATSAVTSSNITTALGYTPINKAGDTVTGTLTFTSGTVTGVTSPVNSSDVATKAYVDATASSLDVHPAVIYATTTSNVYTVTYANGTAGVGATLTNAGTLTAFSIDGTTPVAGDRVLIKNQATASQNGIYNVTTVGNGTTAWVLTRAVDADNHVAGQVHAGMFVFVGGGSTLANSGWVEATIGTGTGENTIIGTDSQTFTQFSGAGTYLAQTPLVLTGNTFSISGLAGYGTGFQFVNMNSAGTALQYSTVSAGTGISVTNAAGSVTIANTGVTSVAVSGGTTGLTTSGGPITTTGTITFAGTLNVANGGTGLSSTPANGQIDIGNGTNFTRATLTAGTGVSITNGAGSITINNTGVTSVNASGGTTGLTFSGGPVTTTGTLTLAGTLATANGGTGLTSIGTAYQVVSVNSGATGLAYATLTAGTGVSITNAAGSITIANTGVTSVGLSVPSFLSVTNSPITTTGTIAVSLATQATNLVFAAPNGSTGVPTFRSLVYADLPIKLWAENVSSPHAPSATGTNAIAEGSGSSATIWGERAWTNDQFATAGDSQNGNYILRAITTTASATTLYLDAGGTQSLVVPNNSVWTFSILVSARRTDATGGAAGYKFEGILHKDATAGSLAFVGTPSKSVLGETNVAWDATLSVNTTNGALQITGTGEAAKTIRWVAVVNTSEVTN